MKSSLIVETQNKSGGSRKPFIITKASAKENHPEGRFSVYLYTRKVFKEGKFFFRYSTIKFDKHQARFKTRDDAKEYALYRLGL
ncbi:MAG: hypothetical protein ACO3FO_06265 [Candidatus Nanopelagicaceae bacterium]